MRVSVQISVASVLLLTLGYIYGSSEHTLQSQHCALAEKTVATLTETIALAPTQARYVFTDDHGCSALVYAPRFPVLVRGTIASITGVQETPEEAFKNIPEYAEFLRRDAIALVVRNPELTVIQNGNAVLDTFRIATASRIATLFREPDSSLLIAMLTGDQGGIGSDVKDAYRKSGITHILSISGLHVSIIAVVLTMGIGLFQIPAYIRSTLIFCLLWLYVAGVGSPASAVRAGVFWTLFVFAYHARAFIGSLTVILLTLTILLTYNPTIISTIGFQLSVSAVCGIGIAIFFVRRIRSSGFVKAVLTLLAVSFGATLTTAPLTMYYFGNISLVGFITNILVVPLLPFLTYLVLISLAFAPLMYPIALVIAFVVHVFFGWILFVAMLCASIPYGNFENISFPLWGVLLYYSVLVVGIIGIMQRYKISWRQWWI